MQDLANKIGTRTQAIYLSLEKNQEKQLMASMLFKIKCEKGHKANALIWDDQTIEDYIKSKKCNSCGALLHQLSK